MLQNLPKKELLEKKIKGFTLIELIVSVGIMMVLFTGTYARYRTYSANKLVEAEGMKVLAALRVAQENALSGKMSATCKDSPPITSTSKVAVAAYEFYRSGTNSYGFRVRCKLQNNTTPYTYDDPDFDLYTMPTGMSLAIGGSNYVAFFPLGKGANARTLTVTKSGLSVRYVITVTANGDVAGVLQ